MGDFGSDETCLSYPEQVLRGYFFSFVRPRARDMECLQPSFALPRNLSAVYVLLVSPVARSIGLFRTVWVDLLYCTRQFYFTLVNYQRQIFD